MDSSTKAATDGVWQRRDAFAEALRVAIAARGVSLDWLQQRLAERATPVSLATLSYWRSGRSQPEHASSLDAVDSLEELLNLEIGHLRSLVPPSRRAGPLPTYADGVGEPHPSVRAALNALGIKDLDRLVDTSAHVIVEVGGDGRIHEITTRTIWRARRDGQHRFPFIITLDPPDLQRVELDAVSGCQVGQRYRSEDGSTHVAEMLMPAALLTGETAVSETIARFPDGLTDTIYDYTSLRRINELLIWVRFASGRHPQRITADHAFGDEELTRRLALDGAGSCHAVWRGFGPGRAAISWSW